MPLLSPINVKLKLRKLHCYDEGDGPGKAEPYLWPIFFKIDGESISIDANGNFQGSPVVKITSGSQKNLHHDGVGENDEINIPESVGSFTTSLIPIPMSGVNNVNVPGFIGCLVILLEEDNTPNADIKKAYKKLNDIVSKALKEILSKINLIDLINDPNLNNLERKINQIKGKIERAVKNAVKENVTVWEWLIGVGDMDDTIGNKVFRFTHNEILSAGQTGITFSKRWRKEGDWKITGKISLR